MTASNYPAALAETLKWEGGFVDHPQDPGGATNMGITIGTLSDWLGRPATVAEVRNLSRATAELIYRKRYWARVRGDEMPDGIDLVAFDGAVNSGVTRGARWLQTALRVVVDGAIGPLTVRAAQTEANGVAVIQRACAARMGFLRGLRTWGTFGRGWTRRVTSIEAAAVAMNTRSPAAVRAEAQKATGTAAKQTTGAAGAAVGGGTSAGGIETAPDLLVYGLIGVAILVALVLVSKARINRARARAYELKAEEMQE